MEDAIVSVLLNYSTPATQFLREKYTQPYMRKLSKDYGFAFNNAKVHKFMETGEIRELEDNYGQENFGCIFCNHKDEYASSIPTRLFTFYLPQGLSPRVSDHYLICDECLKQVSMLSTDGHEAPIIDTCISCEEAYTVLPEEHEERKFKNQVGLHHCTRCLIEAGYLDEKIEQEHQCPGCPDWKHWQLSFNPVLKSNRELCVSCDLVQNPQNDDTDVENSFDVPPNGYIPAEEDYPREWDIDVDGAKPYYHLINYLDTGYGALIYSLDEFKRERLSFDIVKLTEDKQKVDVILFAYGSNHLHDYDRKTVSHLERMMTNTYAYIKSYIKGELVSI